MVTHFFKPLAALAVCFLVVSCAVQPLQIGASRGQVLAYYGEPTRVVATATGSRLQYSRQPAGQSAVMVDLDAADRVVSVRQMLNPAGFAAVVVGESTRQGLEHMLGRPASVDRVRAWPGDILTYRWRDGGGQDMVYWFYLDANQTVQRTGQAMEFPVRVEND